MYTRFTTLTNELNSLGRIILEEDKVEKILTRVLPVSQESKITAIQESNNIATLRLDELIGNLTAYELRRQTMKIDTPKKERSLALRIAEGSDLEDNEMAMITRKFKKYLMRGKGSSRGTTINKLRALEKQTNEGCYRCDEDSEDEAEEEQVLMAIGESDDEQELVELLLDCIDESEIINNEKEVLSRECVILKEKFKSLESRDNESDNTNVELKNQVLELDNSVLELRSENLKLKLGTGKKKADHTYFTLEENLGKMKDELYKKDELIKVLKEDLGKVKHELDRTCKWNKASDALSRLQEHHNSNKRGLGYGTQAPKWDSRSKYLTLPENKICTHCGKVQVKGKSQIWYMDSGCSKHITGNKDQFLSLEDLKGCNVSFGNGKKGEIIGVGKAGKTDSHSIENVYLIDGLKYSLISVSQLCDSGNLVAFTSTKCFLINLTTDKIILQGKRVNNMYIVDFSTLSENELTCLSVLVNDPLLWHKRLGHACLNQLNKLVCKDLVIGLPNIKFKEDNICEACARGKQGHEHEDEAIGLIKELTESPTQVKVASKERTGYGTGPSNQGNLTGGTNQGEIESNPLEELVHEPVPQQQNMGETSSRNQLIVKPHKYQSSHPIENIITDPTSGVKTRSQLKNLCIFYAFLSLIELKNLVEALQDAYWVNAMQDELNQFERNQVWHLVLRPKDKSVIGTKWVFRNKLDEDGTITRNKARLVVQGFSQEEGIDYDETFAPVARLEAIRLLIAFTAQMEFTLHQMDVKSAFLNEYLKEEMFVKQPPGFESKECPEHVYKLDKALYGLKQAPRAWYERLSKFLLEHGYKIGKLDSALFLRGKGKDLLVVQIYVDDIIFGATTDRLSKDFAKLMGSLQIKQSPNGTMIHQQKYTKELIKKFKMEESKEIDTPIATATKLDIDELGSSVDQKLYRGMIGSLLYITTSKPDIIFSVGLCARFQANPNESHLTAVKRILRYLKGTTDLCLWFLSGQENTSGMAHFLGSCLVSWATKKQNSVAPSTSEVEYVVVSSCCAQLLWIKQQLVDFGIEVGSKEKNMGLLTLPKLKKPLRGLNLVEVEVKRKKKREGASGDERGNGKEKVLVIYGGVEEEGSGSGEAAEGLVHLSKQQDEPGSSVEETVADLLKRVGASYDPKKHKASTQKAPTTSKPTKKSKMLSPKTTKALEESKKKKKEKGKAKAVESSEVAEEEEEEEEEMELVHQERGTTVEVPTPKPKRAKASSKKSSSEPYLAKRTRSAVKGKQVKITEAEEEEESEKEEDRFVIFGRRIFLNGRLLRDLDEPGMRRLVDALAAQGWKDMVLEMDGRLARKELIEFTANATVKNGVVTSIVKGVRVQFDALKLGKILDISSERYDDYTRQRWPCLDSLPTALQITRKFCDVAYAEDVLEVRFVQKSKMRPKHKGLFKFVNKCLLPR
ncbi:uncharacterized protein [Nicotiana sylvestris]|uniref:uncharacterized protein n=1 Tax=Nicotiana sylvestris TaxID=4096 RepID=UPI00388C616F